MKLQCENKQLKKVIGQAQVATSKHAGLPALASVYLSATKANGLSVRGTNLSIGIETTIPARVEKEGEVLLDGQLLLNIVASLPDDDLVTLETTNDTLCDISTPNSQTTIKLQSHEDFPTLPHLEENTPSITVDVVDFLSLMKSVMYAASSSEIKPEISSVYIYVKNNQLTTVSTDSFRLAEKSLQIPGIPDTDGIMVPVRNINHIVRVLGEVEGAVNILFGDNQVNWVHPNIYITSRTVDGNYPDYEKIIPTSFQTQVTLLKKDVTDALKVLKIFADRFYQVDMTVATSDSSTTLTSYSNDIGQSTNTLTCAIEGEDIHMRFNGRYMNDALGSITSDSIRLDMTGPGKPLVMSGVGQDDFRYLIMPMNRG